MLFVNEDTRILTAEPHKPKPLENPTFRRITDVDELFRTPIRKCNSCGSLQLDGPTHGECAVCEATKMDSLQHTHWLQEANENDDPERGTPHVRITDVDELVRYSNLYSCNRCGVVFALNTKPTTCYACHMAPSCPSQFRRYPNGVDELLS